MSGPQTDARVRMAAADGPRRHVVRKPLRLSDKYMQKTLTSLIFSPWASANGGVVNFVDTLVDHLEPNLRAERFLIGQRPGVLGRLLRVLMPLYDAARLALILLKKRHDVYHLNPSFVPRSVLREAVFLLVLRAFRRRNVLVFVHGWDPAYYSRLSGNALYRKLFSMTYGKADRLIVLAGTFARDLRRLGVPPERIHVQTTMFDGRLLRDVARRRLDDEVWILFMARLVAAKGIGELMEAFAKVHAEDARLRLIMAGDGPQLKSAQAWCRANGLEDVIRFTGHVTGHAKAQLMADCDIFVLPSYREGCPVALLEAMASGLPVVVTPVGGVPDIVRQDVHGLLVQARDPDSIAEALASLAQDAQRRRAMGQHNREDAWRNYEASAIAAVLASHYRQAAGSGGRRLL